MSKAEVLFDKAIEAYNSTVDETDEAANELKLAQALSYMKRGIAEGATPWAYGFLSRILLDLNDETQARNAVNSALKLDKYQWQAMMTAYWLEGRALNKRAKRFGSVANHSSGGIGESIGLFFVGQAYVNWDGIISAAENLRASFEDNYEDNNDETNANRAVFVVETVVSQLMRAKKGNWRKAATSILNTVVELVSATTVTDEKLEARLRDVEATAEGYLHLLKK